MNYIHRYIQEKELLKSLSLEESGHKSALTKILSNTMNPDEPLLIDPTEIPNLIHTETISGDSTTLEILNIALSREIKTGNLYKSIIESPSTNRYISAIYEELYRQECDHAQRIEKLLAEIN